MDRPERPSLHALTSRPDFDAGIGDIIRRIRPAADEAEAIDLLSLAAARLGADGACFVTFMREDRVQASYRYLFACDPRWSAEYVNGWGRADPWLAYAMASYEPVRASQLKQSRPEKEAMVRAAAERGFRSVVIVPVPCASGEARQAALYIGSASEGYYDGDGFKVVAAAASGLAREFNTWWIRRARARLLDEAGITGEELQLLRYEKQGHGSKAVAAALHTDVKTIDSKFSRLNVKLGVANRGTAVQLATLYKLI